MKISHATIATLLGLVAVVGSSAYGQSGGGTSGGGGASGGAASGNVGGAVGSGGVGGVTGAGGVTGTGSGTGGSVGAGAGIGTGGAFGGAGNMGFGAQNPNFNRSGGSTSSAFGAQQGQRGFAQRQSFNQPQQFSPNSAFNQNQQGGEAGFNRNERLLDRESGENNSFSNQGDIGFDAQSNNGFTQDMANQGSFGLGNGNRSSFFDNQPFNDQGFGQGTQTGANAGFHAANDPNGVNGTASAFDDSVRSGEDGGTTDFSGSTDTSFRGQQFGIGDTSGTGNTEFGMTPAERSGAGTMSCSGTTAGADSPFTGTPSPLSRSTPLGTGSRAASDPRGASRSDSVTTSSNAGGFGENRSFEREDSDFSQTFDNSRARSAAEPDNGGERNFGDSSARAFNNGNGATTGDDPKTKGGLPVERAQGEVGSGLGGNLNQSGTFDGRSTGDASDFFAPRDDGDGFDDTHDPVVLDNGINRSQARSGAFSGSTSGNTSNIFVPRGEGSFDDTHDPVELDNGARSSQGGSRSGLFGPGGYGFMNQYSNGQNVGRVPDGRAGAMNSQPGAGNRARNQTPNAGRPRGEGQGLQQNSQQQEPRNYFNGSYSRSRL